MPCLLVVIGTEVYVQRLPSGRAIVAEQSEESQGITLLAVEPFEQRDEEHLSGNTAVGLRQRAAHVSAHDAITASRSRASAV